MSTTHGATQADTGARNGNGHAPLPLNGSFDLRAQVEEVEKALILRALEASNGNRREAASLLGISLRTLFYKLRRVQATA